MSLMMAAWIVTGLVFIATASFATWAFLSRQDYKNNADQKIKAAVEVTEKNVAAEKDNEFVEKEKYPLKAYNGPADLGAFTLEYPKTWSAYVSTGGGVNNEFIFHPDVVRAANSGQQQYALRVTIEETEYNQVITQYDSQIQQGSATVVAYSLPKVPSVVGVRFDGEIEVGKPGALVVLPLRDKTIKIACEIPDRLNDFNRIILPSFSFNP